MAGEASEAVARGARTPPDSLGGHVDPWGPYAPRGGNAATECGNSDFSPSSMQWRGSTLNCTDRDVSILKVDGTKITDIAEGTRRGDYGGPSRIPGPPPALRLLQGFRELSARTLE